MSNVYLYPFFPQRSSNLGKILSGFYLSLLFLLGGREIYQKFYRVVPSKRKA